MSYGVLHFCWGGEPVCGGSGRYREYLDPRAIDCPECMEITYHPQRESMNEAKKAETSSKVRAFHLAPEEIREPLEMVEIIFKGILGPGRETEQFTVQMPRCHFQMYQRQYISTDDSGRSHATGKMTLSIHAQYDVGSPTRGDL